MSSLDDSASILFFSYIEKNPISLMMPVHFICIFLVSLCLRLFLASLLVSSMVVFMISLFTQWVISQLLIRRWPVYKEGRSGVGEFPFWYFTLSSYPAVDSFFYIGLFQLLSLLSQPIDQDRYSLWGGWVHESLYLGLEKGTSFRGHSFTLSLCTLWFLLFLILTRWFDRVGCS